MYKSQSAGFKWERASLSNSIPNLAMVFYASYGVCFVIVTVRLGYSRFHKAELGLGMGWGCLVSPVRLTHKNIL